MRDLGKPIAPGLPEQHRAIRRRWLIQGTVLWVAGAACLGGALAVNGFRDVVLWMPEIAAMLLISGMGVNGWAKYLKDRSPRR